MKSNKAEPAYETLEIGTPLDYTSDMYRVYFELRDVNDTAFNLLTEFVGSERASRIERLPHGYQVELPIQCVPDVVSLLRKRNIAIYQVVRYAKTSDSWPGG